ncbi:trimeric intracellular cation channel family protein [Pikeienuella piscinae]|uniref:Trimeric intracellular cation channel family protein n=1 Tax=Pikeienuella piscinae TaxID=2748098 RepID=A0A7L5C2F7_9RHOB|nr:trimeric intracellular cation channel family protein [Pikeienuella piscinae]QIE57027.1 trimeric intracellular cation channel family protein [Pikeienuella piscinae]
MNSFQFLDYLGVAVFAISGALVASRKEFDLIGFALLATLAGIGGGTTRDLLIGRPVFWVNEQGYLAVCLIVALAIYFYSPFIGSRYRLVLWADAIGLAAYGALGADIALKAGVDPLVAVVMGMMTATFGGIARDLIAGEPPVALRHEIHVTASLLSAAAFVAFTLAGVPPLIAFPIAALAGFGLRAGAILRGWSLPRYRPRPGRET